MTRLADGKPRHGHQSLGLSPSLGALEFLHAEDSWQCSIADRSVASPLASVKHDGTCGLFLRRQTYNLKCSTDSTTPVYCAIYHRASSRRWKI